MKLKMSQAQLESALRSHFRAAAEQSEPASLGRTLRTLPSEPRPVRGSLPARRAFLALAAVLALAAATIGLPFVLTRPGPASSGSPNPSESWLPADTPTPVASDEAPESPVWSEEPSDELQSPEASLLAADTGDPNWWRTVAITYTARVKGNTRDYVTVTTQGPARCGTMIVHYGGGRMDQPLGGFALWRDASRPQYIDVQETFVGVASARMSCWRDGANRGPHHDWTLAITVDPADPWTVTAWVVLDPGGRSGKIHATTSNWMFSCAADVVWPSGDVQYFPLPGTTDTEVVVDFTAPAAAPAGTANFEVVCTDQWGVTNHAYGTFEILPLPTPAPSATEPPTEPTTEPTTEPPTPAPTAEPSAS